MLVFNHLGNHLGYSCRGCGRLMNVSGDLVAYIPDAKVVMCANLMSLT